MKGLEGTLSKEACTEHRIFSVHHSIDVKIEELHLVAVVVVGEHGGGPRGPQQQGAGGGAGHGEGEEGGALQWGTPRLYLYPAVRLQSGCSAAVLHDQCIHCSHAKMQLKVDSN